MKNYNAEKISLTNFTFVCMFDLGSYPPASDNFAGGYTESLACSQFLVILFFYSRLFLIFRLLIYDGCHVSSLRILRMHTMSVLDKHVYVHSQPLSNC